MTQLPPLNFLYIRGNKFEGSLNFGNLPARIYKIDASRNNFSGTVSFGSIPQSLRSLNIMNNNLQGEVMLTQDIFFIKKLRIKGNNFDAVWVRFPGQSEGTKVEI